MHWIKKDPPSSLTGFFFALRRIRVKKKKRKIKNKFLKKNREFSFAIKCLKQD